MKECSFTNMATPSSSVSAFCRAVLANLIPHRFWGEGDDGRDNKTHIMYYVDHFVHLRKFETLSLHTVFQGVKVRNEAQFWGKAHGYTDESPHMAEPAPLSEGMQDCNF